MRMLFSFLLFVIEKLDIVKELMDYLSVYSAGLSYLQVGAHY